MNIKRPHWRTIRSLSSIIWKRGTADHHHKHHGELNPHSAFSELVIHLQLLLGNTVNALSLNPHYKEKQRQQRCQIKRIWISTINKEIHFNPLLVWGTRSLTSGPRPEWLWLYSYHYSNSLMFTLSSMAQLQLSLSSPICPMNAPCKPKASCFPSGSVLLASSYITRDTRGRR